MLRIISIITLCIVLVSACGFAKDTAVVDELVRKALDAAGGEAALGKIVAFEFESKGTFYEGGKKSPLSNVVTQQGYEKSLNSIVLGDPKSESIEVINGKEGWIKDLGKDIEKMSAKQVESRLEAVYLSWIMMTLPFHEKQYSLESLPEMSVSGRQAFGLLVRHEKHDPIKLYFDKETFLLAKYERTFNNVEAGMKMTETTKFYDYKTVQGIKQPFKLTTFEDGIKVSDLAVARYKFHDKPVEARLFAKP